MAAPEHGITIRRKNIPLLLSCLLLILASSCRNNLPGSAIPPPTEILATNTHQTLPDLQLSDVKIEGGASDACLSEEGLYTFAVKVINKGNASAAPFTVRFNRLHQEVSQSLVAGEEKIIYFRDENLQLSVEIDSGNNVYESNEDNNIGRYKLPSPTPAPHCLQTATPAVALIPPLATLQGHTDRVLTVDFAPDGQLIASGSVDNTLRLWRVNEGTLLRTMLGHPFPVLRLAFSPDGSYLATGSTDGIIRLWRVSNGQLVKNLLGHAGWISSINYSADRKFMASSAQDFTVRLWRTSDYRLVQTIDEGMSIVNQIVFSPESAELAWGEFDGTIRIRSLDGNWIQKLNPGAGQVTALAYSPNADSLAAGFENGTILIWNIPGCDLFQTIEAHGTQISQLDFSPDGDALAAGSFDGWISLWRKNQEGTLFELGLIFEGHEGPVNAISFSPDGRFVGSGGDDATVRIWAVPAE